MISIIIVQKSELEESKKEIKDKLKQKLNTLITQNKKEAQEKDKSIIEMLEFTNSIGLDEINQTRLKTIIDTVNISPGNHDLQQKIDFEN